MTSYISVSIGGGTPTANFAVIGRVALAANQCSDAIFRCKLSSCNMICSDWEGCPDGQSVQ